MVTTAGNSPDDALVRLRLIEQFFERAHVSMWACDSDFKVVLWNKGAEEIYGRAAEDMIGQVFFEVFVDEAERDDAEQDTRRIIEYGETFRNFLAFDKGSDGRNRQMLTNCFRVIDPETKLRYQAEIAIEISDLEMKRNEHRTLRELSIARQAELRHAIQRNRDNLLTRIDRIRQEVDSTYRSISHEIDNFRTSARSRTRAGVEQMSDKMRSALESEHDLAEAQLENFRLRALAASTQAELDTVDNDVGKDPSLLTERLRRSQSLP
jgi:PAS domain S-box-containing protein